MALKGTQFASITSYNYSSMHWVGSYSLLSQDVINNQSTIRLYGSLYNSNEYGYSYGSDDSTLKVNGTTVYSGSYRAYEGYTEMGHTDIVVTHNANGTFPSQTISIYASSYHFNGQSASGTISNIPALDRVAPTVTVSLASRTSNSLTINATASANCDYWEFSRDDGSTFPYTSSTEGTAVSYTFTGLSPNTTYNIKVRARKKVNQIKGTSARGAYTTIGNALLNSVAEVYADASTVIIKPNMTVYGASFTYTLEIKRGNTSILTLSIPAQSTGTKDVSVTLSSAQRTTLLSGMSNVASFSATYILKTLNNGTQVGSTSSATATIKTSSSTSAPSQASFSYADTNAKTVAVTGDSTKLVQGQSTLRLTNLTATAKNGASVASYNITIGGVTKSSTSGGTVDIGTISQSGTLSLSVVVTDSRGYTSTKTQSITCYAYSPPSISAYSVKRNASTSTQIDMSFSGVFSNIGSNTVTATYKYKQSTAGSYSAETSVTPTISGGTFSYSGTNVATFSDEYVYDFVITLADGILTESYYMRVPSYEPLIGFRPNSVGFGTVPQQQFNLETSDRWGTHFRGQYNRSEYGSYSFSTPGVDGTAGWIRIATITFKPTVGTFASEPIRFEVARRYDAKTVNLYLRFTHVNSTDPDVDYLYYECSNAGLYYDQPFEAYAVKTSSGIFDVYVKKDTQYGWVDVNTFMPAFMGYRCTISYVDAIATSVPANAFMATQLPIINTAKQNTFNYLPYSWRTTGENSIGWLRIATINILDTYYDSPIEFLVQRRRDGRSVKLSVMFATGNTSDPALSSFHYDDISDTQSTNRFQAFMYKTATSTWDVYVHESGTYDSISVSVIAPYYAQRWGSITYSYSLLSSVPSGATMALPINEWRIIHSASPGGQTLISCTGTLSTSFFRMWEKSNHEEYSIEGRWRITDFVRTSDRPGFSFQTNARPYASLYGYMGLRTDGNSSKTVVPEPLVVSLDTSGLITIRGMETYWNCVSGGSIWFTIPRTNFSYDYNS